MARLLLVEDEPAHRDFYKRFLGEDERPKIVINTNYESFKLDFVCWGADAFVVKSSDPSELKRKVNQVLSNQGTGRKSRN